MAISERDDTVIGIYAEHIGKALGEALRDAMTDARRDRLAVLLWGPWLDDDPGDDRPGRKPASAA